MCIVKKEWSIELPYQNQELYNNLTSLKGQIQHFLKRIQDTELFVGVAHQYAGKCDALLFWDMLFQKDYAFYCVPAIQCAQNNFRSLEPTYIDIDLKTNHYKS